MMFVLQLLAAVAAATTPPPICAAVKQQDMVIPQAERHVFSKAGDRDLALHVLAPDDARTDRTAIIFFFGGGWTNGQLTHFQDQARYFRDRGAVTVLADYRVFCRDGSTPRDAVEDARNAYEWVRAHAAELGVDSHRIVLGGGSAGGHLAASVAAVEPAGKRPAALILFNPVVDLTLPAIRPSVRMDMEAARRISPALLPATGLPPTMMFHGDADAVAPIGSTDGYCLAIRKAGGVCTLNIYPGASHGFFNKRETVAALGTSYYLDTLGKADAFLVRQGLLPPKNDNVGN